MEVTEINQTTTALASRVSLWGLIIVGFLGLILAVNASWDDQFIGAGVCLAASALAFGAIGYVFTRR